jgi:hypothetical protein
MRQDHARAKALEERLVDLRIRHDLGLRVDAQTYFARSEAEQAMAKPQVEQQLTQEQQQLAALQQRFGELQQRLDRHTTARRTSAHLGGDPNRVAMPTLPFASPHGDDAPLSAAPPPAAPLAETRRPHDDGKLPRADDSERALATNAGRTHSTPAATEAGAPQRPAVLIHGSRDHSVVGRALFEAGEYEKARDELLLLEKDGGKMAAVDLFYLARCHERLGERAAADSAFARVEALDSKEGPDGKMVPGRWAQAARVSRQQMNWEAEKGGWRPSRSIESIKWRNP